MIAEELKTLRAIVENFDFKFLRILISLFKRNENVRIFRFSCISARTISHPILMLLLYLKFLARPDVIYTLKKGFPIGVSSHTFSVA